MPHFPNPFDFVPFPSAPILRAEEQFDALGEKLSGYLELEIKALTPVHVVGRVEGGAAENQSFFFQQNDQPCIPASSIRGCLRAFTEALTAEWVSQWTQEYQKVYGRAPGMRNKGRHIGFLTFEDDKNDRQSVHNSVSRHAVNHAFKPNLSEGKLDVASYLFGIVAEGKQTGQEEQARKSKLWVEDAYLDLTSISWNDYWIPDIAIGNAFMGGAKPSASNWWYFKPAEIWKRNLPGTAPVAEFVGKHFRGRKFYYHQDPIKCIEKYDQKNGQWDYNVNTFHRVRLECMAPEKTTLRFRIYLDGVPRPLFWLLINILLPGEHIRHKLGYAKAYGYGSIEFILKSAKLRTVGLGIPNALELWHVLARNWNKETLVAYGVADFIDPEALAWLARILGWPHEDLLFMYPQYRAHEFKQPIKYSEFEQMVKIKMSASAIAKALWNLKRPIDFRLYQERANRWNVIQKRIP